MTLRIGVTHEIARSCRERFRPRERSPHDPCCKRSSSSQRSDACPTLASGSRGRKSTFPKHILKTPNSNELMLAENPLPTNSQEQPVGRVRAYSFGYDRDMDWIPHVAAALGVQVTAYGVGNRLKPIYGSQPVGVAIFLRLRPFSGDQR